MILNSGFRCVGVLFLLSTENPVYFVLYVVPVVVVLRRSSRQANERYWFRIHLSSPLPSSTPLRPDLPLAGALEPYLWMHVLWIHGSCGWHEPRRYLGQDQEQPVDVGEFIDVF